MCVSGSLRPSKLVSVRRCDWIPRALHLLNHWVALPSPDDGLRPSVTQVFNGSVLMGDPRLKGMAALWRSLRRDGSTARVWNFAYPRYPGMFEKVISRRGSPPVCPFERWSQTKSMARYLREARLANEGAELSPKLQQQCQDGVGRLADVFLDRSLANSDLVTLVFRVSALRSSSPGAVG